MREDWKGEGRSLKVQPTGNCSPGTPGQAPMGGSKMLSGLGTDPLVMVTFTAAEPVFKSLN